MRANLVGTKSGRQVGILECDSCTVIIIIARKNLLSARVPLGMMGLKLRKRLVAIPLCHVGSSSSFSPAFLSCSFHRNLSTHSQRNPMSAQRPAAFGMTRSRRQLLQPAIPARSNSGSSSSRRLTGTSLVFAFTRGAATQAPMWAISGPPVAPC